MTVLCNPLPWRVLSRALSLLRIVLPSRIGIRNSRSLDRSSCFVISSLPTHDETTERFYVGCAHCRGYCTHTGNGKATKCITTTLKAALLETCKERARERERDSVLSFCDVLIF